MTEQELAVYRHVQAKLDAGDVVSRTNRGYGPMWIAYALHIDEEKVKSALAALVERGWFDEMQKPSRYVLGPNAPALDNPIFLPRTANKRYGSAPVLPPELAKRIGMQTAEKAPEPLLMLDWALRWATRDLHVFPCQRFLGIPLVAKWYAAATDDAARIVEWWSEWPEADIAGVPDKSGHFVIVASGEEGAESLADIEAEYGVLPTSFRYFNRSGDSEHLWLKGSAVTSHHRLGRGLRVLGGGHYVYLPASWAPDHLWRAETDPAAWPISAP